MSTFETATTVPGLLRGAAQRFGTHPAVVDGETRLSYRELAGLTERAARAFRACGTQPGERVALWMPNRAEYIVAALGALAAGAALVPMNTRYRGQEAAAILARSRAATLVTSNGFLGTDYLRLLREAAAPDSLQGGLVPGLPFLRTLVDVPGDGASGTLTWSQFLERSAEVPVAEAGEVADQVQGDDLCDVLFTSGTTGRPKGVMSAHRQTVDVARIWAAGAQLTDRDRYAIVNPFFHGFGYKAGIIAALGAGATIYPVATLDADALLALVERERISVMPGAPALFLTLLEHPRRSDYDLSSLRFATAGAATVPESLFSRMRDELGFAQVAQAYGLTECIMVSRSRVGEDPLHVAETTGPPVPGIELRVIDTASGAEAPTGADGEIFVRGRNVMLGYFEDEAATREVIDADGWLHTGDIGRLDDHGCLKITDRLKDMFTVGGFNVYPAEVENVLAGHPEVSEAAVVARQDPRLGSAGHAFVVPVPGAAPDPADLIVHCRARLANFKVPREITLVTSLPRNASGKILKRELRADARLPASPAPARAGETPAIRLPRQR